MKDGISIFINLIIAVFAGAILLSCVGIPLVLFFAVPRMIIAIGFIIVQIIFIILAIVFADHRYYYY